MANYQKFLSVFIDATSFATPVNTDSMVNIAEIQKKTWKEIKQRMHNEFPSSVRLLEPIDGAFIDTKNCPVVIQSLQIRNEFTQKDSDRFRNIVVEAYSSVLGIPANCRYTEIENHPSGSLFG